MLVYDLIYNPRETALLREAKVRGAKVSNGLGMLFYQGVLAFQHWAEIDLPQNIKNKMRQALEEGRVV
jgi:shikimate dehydrogenase